MASESVPLDLVFHALADPTRRAVIGRLGKGSATVKELSAPFAMALPSFLKHITVLESARLIRCHKQGRVRTCALERDNLAAAEQWFDEQRQLWQARYDTLEQLMIQSEHNES